MKIGRKQIFTKNGSLARRSWSFHLQYLVPRSSLFLSSAPPFYFSSLRSCLGRIKYRGLFHRGKTTGLEHIVPDRSYVVVANHQSLIDIYLLYGFLNLAIKWVTKQEPRTVLVLGLAYEMMRHVIIDRSNTRAALASRDRAREHVKEGMSVVFFAKSTRSRDEKLRPFKKVLSGSCKNLARPSYPSQPLKPAAFCPQTHLTSDLASLEQRLGSPLPLLTSPHPLKT